VACLLRRLHGAVGAQDDAFEVLGVVLEDKVDEALRRRRQMRSVNMEKQPTSAISNKMLTKINAICKKKQLIHPFPNICNLNPDRKT